jgi:transposase
MKRHAMSDEQWAALESLLPVNTGRGRRWTDHRRVIDGILWVLNTGAAWRDMPERFGPWQTIYHRFNTWTKDGTWQRISQALLAKLHRQRQIEWDLVAIDATHIRASHAAAGARKKGASSVTKRAQKQMTKRSDARAAGGAPSST